MYIAGGKSMNEIYNKLCRQLNQETKEHSERVSRLCKTIASEIGLDEELAERIGLLHDIGKMYVPSRILKKNGKLNDVEREIVDLHSYIGYQMLKDWGEEPEIYIPVLYHHGFNKPKLSVVAEKPDAEMAKYIYLVHSVDIYDAMTHKRSYHNPIEKSIVYEVLEDDYLCTDELLNHIKSLKKKKKGISEGGER